MAIHPTAIIEPGARLLGRIEIGPYCVVGSDVELGEGTRLGPHAVVIGCTRLGRNNQVGSFSVLGGAPQDKKHGGEESRLELGDGNIIREYVTINTGTAAGRISTRVGSGGYFMAGSHIAHDCLLGDRVILANNAALAGHVEVGEGAVIGGMAGVHQFVRIGRLALVAAGSMVAADVPPFLLAQGDRARLLGLNRVGLERAGVSRAEQAELRAAYRRLFQTGALRSEVLADLRDHASPCVRELAAFFAATRRGFCRSRLPGGVVPGGPE